MVQNATQIRQNTEVHRAQLGVECPQCHWRQFVEIHLEEPVANSPMAFEIRRHLEAWMASHCPDHLNAISKLSKN
ncbi:MAG: hypothetical protein ACRD2B_00430 [Terriglobia bacterium]